MASDTIFAIGDILTLTAQSAVDATLANLGISLAGTRASTPADGGAPNDAQYLVAAAHAGLTSELVVTSAGLALLDDANNTAQRTTLGLGTMATQNENAVAITDGQISIGGHAPTGVLDVQTSVMASDTANSYYGVRIWPTYPAGATGANPIRIEAASGAGLSTAPFRGLTILDQPAGLPSAYALNLAMSAGANRYNVYAIGTAANYFGGTVQVVGNVGIGAAPAGLVALYLQRAKDSAHGMIFHPTVTDSVLTSEVVFQNVAGTTVGSITSTASAVAYNTSSDVRLKHSIATLIGALERIRVLRPISFKWNADDSNGVGFLAHELQQIIPESVTGEPDAINDDGSIKPQQVDHAKLVPWLVAGMKELMAQVETLTARVAALEA